MSIKSVLDIIKSHLKAVGSQVYKVLFYALTSCSIVFLLELFGLDFSILWLICNIVMWIRFVVAEDPDLLDYTGWTLFFIVVISACGLYGSNSAIEVLTTQFISNSSSKHSDYILGFLYHYLVQAKMLFTHRLIFVGIILLFLELILKLF